MHLVVPAGIDDPRSPSGGNTYDRRIRDGLRALGWTVQQHDVAGGWPHPDPAARASLARVLDALPDGGAALLDGLVACGVPEVVVPRAGRLRLVVLVHLPLGDEVGAASRLVDREGRVLRAARAVVATSPWAARRLAEVHALPADRTHVVPPGVDPAPLFSGESRTPGGRSGPPGRPLGPAVPDGSRLLCLGALTPTKGQDLLVAALARLRDHPWTCDLVGPPRAPDFVAALDRAIARHGLADRLRRLGPRPAETCYPDADLLVLPSRAETYGMVIAEALARGIPVVASDVGGVRETLGQAPDGAVPDGAVSDGAVSDGAVSDGAVPDGAVSDGAVSDGAVSDGAVSDGAVSDGAVPGLLVRAEDPDALASALRRWFDEPGLRARLRAAAAARRETLDGWEVTARCLAAVLTPLR